MKDLSISILDTIKDMDKNQWNNLIKQSTLGSVFHSYEWLNTIEKGLGYKPKHILIAKDNNPLGIFPHFILKEKRSPFKTLCSLSPGFGGPIIGTNEEIILPLLFDNVPGICKSNNALHKMILNNYEYSKYGKFLIKSGYHMSIDGCLFEINLSFPYEHIIKNMDHHKRKELKKIKKMSYKVIDQKLTNDIITTFHKIYQGSLEKNNADSYPIHFFQTLATEMNDYIKIFTTYVDEKPIGSILCILDDNNKKIHGFFSAIQSEFFKYKPWIMLHDFVVQWGKKHNYKTYDLGETPANYLDSIYKYKQGFGGSINPILSWEKSYSIIRWNIFKSGRYIYRRFS